jgi:hypothetical protein
MKKQLLFLVYILLVNITASAAVFTVSNNPNTVAQFSTIQLAIDAAFDNDSIYVHGSPNTYASFILLDKKLTIIGPGWAPDKNLGLQAIVSGCTIRNSSFLGSPSGSELHGLIFIQNAEMAQNTGGGDLPVNDLRITRCQFNQTINFGQASTGTIFEGCMFLTTVSFSTNFFYTNILFQNNLIFANTCCTGSGFNGLTNSVNVLFNHNLFYSDNGVAAFGNNCQFLTLSNNIFVERDPASNLSNSTFSNNLTMNCGTNGDTAWIRNGNIDGGGNIPSANASMADQAAVNAGSFSGLLNFTISGGSANNAGNDGKDLGLLFDATGSLNWSNSRNSRLPRIFSMNITAPAILAGSDLNVTVEARKSN